MRIQRLLPLQGGEAPRSGDEGVCRRHNSRAKRNSSIRFSACTPHPARQASPPSPHQGEGFWERSHPSPCLLPGEKPVPKGPAEGLNPHERSRRGQRRTGNALHSADAPLHRQIARQIARAIVPTGWSVRRLILFSIPMFARFCKAASMMNVISCIYCSDALFNIDSTRSRAVFCVLLRRTHLVGCIICRVD